MKTLTTQPSHTKSTPKTASTVKNTHRTKCVKSFTTAASSVDNSLIKLARQASRAESYMSNNNLLGDRFVSDGKKVPKFYMNKANPSDKSSISGRSLLPSGVFTNTLLNQVYDDNKGFKVATNPSNLVEVPRVNEKYEVNSFADPKYIHNLKTTNILRNQDVVLNMNPSFYGGSLTQIGNKKEDDIHNRKGINYLDQAYVNTLVKFDEYDHPLSFHNAATGAQKDKMVSMPTNVYKEKIQLIQNGYYDRDPYSFRGKKLEDTSSDQMYKVDSRLFDQENIFAKGNMLFQPNQILIDQIEMDKHIKSKQSKQEKERIHNESTLRYTIDQMSPTKQTKSPGNASVVIPMEPEYIEYSLSPDKPTLDAKIEDDGKRNIFSVRMDGDESSPEKPDHFNRGVMDEVCRKDLPTVESPIKSVRFDEEELLQSSNKKSLRKSSGKKSMAQSSGRYSESVYSQSSRPRESESELPDSSEEEDDDYDEKLESKLEKIKNNLQGPQKQADDDSHIVRLEEALKRQKDQLDHWRGGDIKPVQQYTGSSVTKTERDKNLESQERINFELSHNSVGGKTDNLTRAYEDLEKEIMDIKRKLQSSLGATNPAIQTQSQRSMGRSLGKSPEMNDEDLSLSVSDLGQSMHQEGMPPRFSYEK